MHVDTGRRIISAYYFLFAVAIALLALKTPHFDWDIIGYTGNALHMSGFRGEALHIETYKQVCSAVPEAVFKAFTEENEYQKTVFADVRAFEEQLPFYAVRPVYNVLLHAISRSGANIVWIAVGISAISVGLSVLLIGLIAARTLSPLPAFLFSFTLLPIGVLGVARTTTPDGMAFLAAIGLFALYQSQKLRALLLLMPFAIAIRTDLLFLTVSFTALLIWRVGDK